MYGSIRKSYGAKKASHSNEKKNSKLFKNKSVNKDDASAEFQDTSYINVEEETSSKKNAKSKNNGVRSENRSGNTGKSEFPIASVILTIVFTMMVMVLAFGFGGV